MCPLAICYLVCALAVAEEVSGPDVHVTRTMADFMKNKFRMHTVGYECV